MTQPFGNAESNQAPRKFNFMRMAWAVAVVWTALIATLMVLDIREVREQIMDLARSEARSTYARDLTYRRWATSHGGVYVPVTEDTSPNPDLAMIPERDITTPSGRRLTLMNPAYMLRQVYSLDNGNAAVRGHITSLNPIRPENAPDAWEAAALQRFAGGEEEYSARTDIDGKPYLRLMHVLMVENGCLKCHAMQGYKEGDVRGGISVSVPLAPMLAVSRDHSRSMMAGYGLVWALGVCGFAYTTRRLNRHMQDRDKSEGEVRRLSRWLLRTQRISKSGSWAVNLKTGDVWASPEARRIYGVAEEGPITLAQIRSIPLPQYRAYLDQALESLVQHGTPYEVEIQIHHGPSGTIADIHSMAEYIADESLFIGVFEDVTERKRAEAALRGSEERYHQLFATMKEGFALHEIICDEHGTPVDYRFLDVNPWFEQSTGIPRSRWIGSTVREVLPDIEDLWIRTYGEVALTGKPVVLDRYVPELGRHYEITAYCPQPRQFAVITTEVTERKRAEEELRKSEERFRAIAANTPDHIVIHDSELRYTYIVNPQLGLTEADMVGKTDRDFLEEKEADHLMAIKRHVLETGEPYYLKTPLLNARGDTEYFDGVLVPKLDASGKVDGIIGYFRNVTESKRAEAETADLQAKLQQSQKLESVGLLAGGVAHDFNNMLAVIIGHVEMLLENVGPDSSLHGGLVEIANAARRSADLTRQMLAFARKQTVVPRALDLNETVSQMLKLVQRLIGEDVELVWAPGHELWPILMDPSQMDQIVANLCVNARDAIGGVGRVTVETSNIVLDAGACAGVVGFVPGEYVRLAVSDSGCGMEKEVLAHIFEPFFTTKELGRGTGMGLATVYGAVKQNRGLIDVDSEPGRGTTFFIYLPRHTGEVGPGAVHVASEPVAHRQATILLVEDDPAILTMAATMIGNYGYTVLPAASPDEAIRLAREHADEIDLLVTDVIMPGMNGRELAEILGPVCPRFKCLFMSGYTSDVIAHHGVLKEGVSFVQKPFTMAELAGSIRKALEGA